LVAGYKNLTWVGDRVLLLLGVVDGFLIPDWADRCFPPVGYPPLPPLVNTILELLEFLSALCSASQTRMLGSSCITFSKIILLVYTNPYKLYSQRLPISVFNMVAKYCI
jgi:hypothetical protein